MDDDTYIFLYLFIHFGDDIRRSAAVELGLNLSLSDFKLRFTAVFKRLKWPKLITVYNYWVWEAVDWSLRLIKLSHGLGDI